LIEKPELAGNMNGIYRFLTEEQIAQFKPVPIPLKKGYATFHHPLLMHGSYSNRTERPRRAFVLNVFKDGVCSDTNEALLQGVAPIPKGQKMGGKFFPLLFEVK
jgi:ectoine hydroxylase-related dioxygenase (phytanoyl-CoA dioxygenase family)